jgi:hypothetical protein
MKQSSQTNVATLNVLIINATKGSWDVMSYILVWHVPLAQVLPHPQLIFPSKTWFFGTYLKFSGRNHFKINISHILLNPNLTK